MTHECELFKMKPEENIQDMKKYFIHIMDNIITLSKKNLNESLVIKVLRCLNHNLQPKITMIYEYRDLSSIVLPTLFNKLQNTKWN